MTKRCLVFFLVNEFTILPFTAAIEALRIANRMLGYQAYKWRLASADGEKVSSSSGIEIAVQTSLAQERRMLSGADRPSMAIICSGIDVETFNNKAVHAWLREAYNRNVQIGSLCTGAHILAQAGLLNGKRCAIHWENLPGFSEAFPEVEVYADLYEVDGNIHTCAGGTASLDMMLNLIGQDFDDNLVNRICEQALTDRVREQSDRQRLPLRARLGVQNAKVLSIIEVMEKNLAESHCRFSKSPTMPACRADRSSACSGRKWAARQPDTTWRSGWSGPVICSYSLRCPSWKWRWPAASSRHRIFPSAIAKSTTARRSRSARNAGCVRRRDRARNYSRENGSPFHAGNCIEAKRSSVPVSP